MSILPRSLRTGDLHDYSFWLQQLIKSVKRNRMTEVMIIVETGGSLLAHEADKSVSSGL